MYDPLATCGFVHRNDKNFGAIVASLNAGDEVEVRWVTGRDTGDKDSPYASIERGVLQSMFDDIGSALSLGLNVLRWGKLRPNKFVSSIRVIKQAEPEWTKAKLIAVGEYGDLYVRHDNGTYSRTLYGDLVDLESLRQEKIEVVVDADGKLALDTKTTNTNNKQNPTKENHARPGGQF